MTDLYYLENLVFLRGSHISFYEKIITYLIVIDQHWVSV